MEQLLRFEAGEGSVLVEVADDEPGIERAARVDDVVVKASQSLESALEQVRVLADVTLARLGGLPGNLSRWRWNLACASTPRQGR